MASLRMPLALLGIFSLVQIGSCVSRCDSSSSVFDNKDFFSCPRPWDDSENIWCCGTGESSYCCSEPEGFSEITESLAKLVGIVIGAAIFVVVVCVICCCCCPFCVLAKKRQRRGEVVRTNDDNPMQSQPHQHPQPSYQPQQQQGYPPQQQQGYPPHQQQGYPPHQQQGYPPQQSYPPQQGYPPMQPAGYPSQSQQGPVGYSPQQMGYPGGYPENPPPYPGIQQSQVQQSSASPLDQKQQLAYNPNY